MSNYLLPGLILIFMLGACSSTGRGTKGSAAANPDQVISSAKEMLGVRYRYGGQNPVSGFDCSGLVLFSYNRAGVKLPRTTIGQFKYSRPIKKSQMRAGDLLFFRISRSRISHVGIYLGDNEFIHAPSSGKKVSIGRLDSPYWSKRFVRAGRV